MKCLKCKNASDIDRCIFVVIEDIGYKARVVYCNLLKMNIEDPIKVTGENVMCGEFVGKEN